VVKLTAKVPSLEIDYPSINTKPPSAPLTIRRQQAFLPPENRILKDSQTTGDLLSAIASRRRIISQCWHSTYWRPPLFTFLRVDKSVGIEQLHNALVEVAVTNDRSSGDA
jgi:hypothetical protein